MNGRSWKCNLCGKLFYIGPDYEDDTDVFLWGHLQFDHEDVYEEEQDLESPYMIETYFTEVEFE